MIAFLQPNDERDLLREECDDKRHFGRAHILETLGGGGASKKQKAY